MSTTVAISLSPEELAELDNLRRSQRTSRAEAICDAVRFYTYWAELLPFEDLGTDEIEP